MTQFSEERKILLPKGETLCVSMTPQFERCVRARFMLNETQLITDEHVRLYINEALQTALKKADML